jgi:hypothetical protein
MSLANKLEKLNETKQFNDHNSENIRIDPNIQYEFILPSNWADLMTTSTRKTIDKDTGEPRSYVETIFKVLDIQSQEQTFRNLRCGESLYNKIYDELKLLMDDGEDGEIKLHIMKEMKGGNKFGEYKVRAKAV